MAKITPAAGKQSTKPAKAPKEKKPKAEKTARIEFTAVGSKDPAVYPFPGREMDGATVATPEGFDHAKHERLGKKDFAKPSLYFTYRAEALEATAAAFRKRAAELKAGGDKKGSGGKVNRLAKQLAKAQEIRAALEAQGIDVDALLASTKAAADAKKAAEQPVNEQA